jgi:hypothetical protein
MKSIVYGLVVLTGLIGGSISAGITGDGIKAFQAFILGLVLGAIYYIPAFIATSKKHPNEVAIVVLNAVAGWTFLGWVGSLVWALVKSDKKY